MSAAFRQQVFWLVCFIAGIWLGVRSGHSTNGTCDTADSAARSDDTALHSAKQGGAATARGTSSSGSSSTESSASHGGAKSTAAAKKATLDDLRRLLALDPYECDLRKMLGEFENISKRLADSDLPVAAAMLWGDHHRFWSVMTLAEVINRWGDIDPKAALDWLRDVKGDEKIARLIRQNVLSQIGKKHPDLLWAEIGPTKEWMEDDWLASGMIGAGFASDLNLAQKFLDAVTDPGVRHFALSAIAGELATKDPAAAIAWLRSQPRSERGDDILSNMYGRLAEKNPDAALAAMNDPSTGLRSQDRERIVSSLAEHHPQRAQAIIAAGGLKSATMSLARHMGWSYNAASAVSMLALAPEVPAGEVRDAFLSQISSRLSNSGDLDRAWQAIGDINPSIERISAMQNYGEARAKKSIADTTTWLSGLPAGADRDAAITGFTHAAIDKQPQMAIEWATAITDPVYRDDEIENAFVNWHRADAKAADVWLSKARALSTADKTRLKEKVADD